MPVNTLRFEESSEIVIDQRSVTPNGGWTITYLGVVRIGALVALHVEASAASAGAICTLPADFAPGQTVTSPDGTLSVTSAGVLSSTAAAVRNELQYIAGAVSP
jgi:hypothetical protein